MPGQLRCAAEAAHRLHAAEEGLALYRARPRTPRRPGTEIGTYCGSPRSTLAAAARQGRPGVITGGPSHGSEENQPAGNTRSGLSTPAPGAGHAAACGGPPSVTPAWRTTWIVIVAVRAVARLWRDAGRAAVIDGGHTEAAARGDYEGWARWVAPGGALAIHDVFPTRPTAARRPTHLPAGTGLQWLHRGGRAGFAAGLERTGEGT